MDLLQGRSEATALEKVSRLIDNEVAVITAHSKEDFQKYCNYISSIDSNHDRRRIQEPLCIHISTHGNKDGIAFGHDFIEWKDLFYSMEPIFTEMKNYSGKVYISISSCDAGYQNLGSQIEKQWERNLDLNPPSYIFVTGDDGGVNWDDSLVAWTILYHKISKTKELENSEVKRILNSIKNTVGTEIAYFRWEDSENRYLRYRGR